MDRRNVLGKIVALTIPGLTPAIARAQLSFRNQPPRSFFEDVQHVRLIVDVLVRGETGWLGLAPRVTASQPRQAPAGGAFGRFREYCARGS